MVSKYKQFHKAADSYIETIVSHKLWNWSLYWDEEARDPKKTVQKQLELLDSLIEFLKEWGNFMFKEAYDDMELGEIQKMVVINYASHVKGYVIAAIESNSNLLKMNIFDKVQKNMISVKLDELRSIIKNLKIELCLSEK